MLKNRKHSIGLSHAINGIVKTVKSQPNFRIHLFFTLAVVFLGIFFNITKTEWIIILFTVMWVIISEMINTSIESMVDLITSQYHQEAKLAKDIAAGTVLVGAIGSIIVGLAIFLPYFVNLIN